MPLVKNKEMLYNTSVSKGMRMTKEEQSKWYKEVDFIQKEMQFYSLEDFVSTAFYYKDMYSMLDRHAKKLYQWYVYANHNLNYNQKNIVWDFLNGIADYPELTYALRVANAKAYVEMVLEQRNNEEDI